MIDIGEILRLHGLWLRGDSDGKRADLRGADLRGADLRGADLRGAVLRGADLRGAVLRGADLRGAVLRGAVLSDAVLRGAVLSDAVLRGADLRGAVLRGAVLSDAVLRDLIVPLLHSRMLSLIEAGGILDMSSWHLNNASCGTQHCRAGWAIHLAGEAGAKLESAVGPAAAGAIITSVSCPYLDRVPSFYCSNEEALDDIRRCAAIEVAQSAVGE